MSVVNAIPLLLADEGYQISRSVRLRSSATAYFNRTPGSAGNRQKWTYSSWVKRGDVGTGSFNLLSASNSSTDYLDVRFESNQLRLDIEASGQSRSQVQTTALFRDPSAWYHLVVVFDSTNATTANRVLMYVNGVAQATSNTINQNVSGAINAATSHAVGRRVQGSDQYFDGYLTEVNFIDGQALTPSSFGETDAITGVWKPKKYTGTYGTNGFYLNFSDPSAATAAAIGKDYSGNGNNWTPNNISVTSGSTYDSMLDVPTLWADGGNGRGNYCTLNPLALTNIVGTFSNGNLQVSRTAAYVEGLSTQTINSGKFYIEAVVTAQSAQYINVGVAQNPSNIASPIAPFRHSPCVGYRTDGQKNIDTTFSAYGSSFTTNDVIGIAVDVPSNSITFYKNNVSQGAISYTFSSADWFVGCGGGGSTGAGADTVVFNFGQRPFAYTPPTGFKALNTQNLPEPVIKKGNAWFDVTTFTANGGVQTVTNSGSMQPDMIWLKDRSVVSNHTINDSVRGSSVYVYPNLTNAEATNANYLTSFNSNGFSLGSANYTNGEAIVGWQWKEGATPGFDIVTFTKSTTNQTVNHSLGVAPAMIIVKGRGPSTSNWLVYHRNANASPQNGGLALEQTAAFASNAGYWNNTSPTSTQFSIGSFLPNENSVAYLFAEVAGFSRFGSYTGNGSSDGPFCFTGFRPKFVLYKRTDTTENWYIQDGSRSPYNAMKENLFPNLSNAEISSANYDLDFTANGFKFRNSSPGQNASGGTYIFAAFAESPQKFSLAR